MLFKIKLNPHMCSLELWGPEESQHSPPEPALCICNSGLSGLRKAPERLSQLKGGSFSFPTFSSNSKYTFYFKKLEGSVLGVFTTKEIVIAWKWMDLFPLAEILHRAPQHRNISWALWDILSMYYLCAFMYPLKIQRLTPKLSMIACA